MKTLQVVQQVSYSDLQASISKSEVRATFSWSIEECINVTTKYLL